MTQDPTNPFNPATGSPEPGPDGQSPYGAPAGQQQPYGAPAGQQQPYGAPAGQQQPYGTPQPPYGSQQAPYWQQDPHSGQARYAQHSPYGATYAGGGAPYGGFGMGQYGVMRPPMGLVQSVKAFFQNYLRFDGRASRGEFWWPTLGGFLLGLAVGLLMVLVSFSETLAAVLWGLVGLFSLAIIVPAIALIVRRLHDTNRSGLMLLIGFIPFVGALVLLFFVISDSDPNGAQYDGPTQPATGE
ncbi:MAG: DUF805 domain-containing protein [Arachnia sp.]